jgi:hypothetical protein
LVIGCMTIVFRQNIRTYQHYFYIYICYKISIFSLVQHDIIKLHHLVRWRPLVTPTSQVGTYRAAEVGGYPMRVFFKEYCTDKWRMIRHYIFFLHIYIYIYICIYIYIHIYVIILNDSANRMTNNSIWLISV